MPYAVIPALQPASSGSPGTIALAADLAGDGTSALTPRVASVTGVGGVVDVRDGAALRFVSGVPSATTGLLRFPNNTTIAAARDSGDSTDHVLLFWEDTDTFVVGAGSGGFAAVPRLYFGATIEAGFFINGGIRLTINDTTATFATPIALAGTVASSGAIRGANATNLLVARNAANSADVCAVAVNSSNELLIGLSTAGGLLPALVYIDNTSGCYTRVSGVVKVGVTSNAVTFGSSVNLVLATASASLTNKIYLGASAATDPWIAGGTGSPEGVHTAPTGSMFLRRDPAGAQQVLYVKESGSGNTGWVAK